MIFAGAAILIAVALGLTLLIRQKDLPPPEPVSPTAHLEEKKKAIYENLRDLQFEYRMGKLSDQDYADIKLDLQRHLSVVLADIEKVKAKAEKADKAPAPPAVAAEPAKPKAVCVCPNCSTEFSRPMKFCGECGQAIPAAS
jgi:hypothetical protein